MAQLEVWYEKHRSAVKRRRSSGAAPAQVVNADVYLMNALDQFNDDEDVLGVAATGTAAAAATAGGIAAGAALAAAAQEAGRAAGGGAQ